MSLHRCPDIFCVLKTPTAMMIAKWSEWRQKVATDVRVVFFNCCFRRLVSQEKYHIHNSSNLLKISQINSKPHNFVFNLLFTENKIHCIWIPQKGHMKIFRIFSNQVHRMRAIEIITKAISMIYLFWGIAVS